MIGLTYGNLASSGVSGFVGLLDTYPNAAAAYSVRRLSGSYNGALMEVRRTVSAVTVTADVAYDSNNELSLDSLITVTSGSSSATNLGEFVGASGYSDPDSLGGGQDAFVRTWYDQSGNSLDFVQTTTANQPQIISSGSLITANGKPAGDFLGSTLAYMQIPSSTTDFTFLMDGTNSLIANVLETGSNVTSFQVPWSNNETGSLDVGADTFILSTQWYQYGRNGTAANRYQNIGGTPVVSTQYIMTQEWDMDNGTAANKGAIYLNGGSAIANNTRATATSASASTSNMTLGAAGLLLYSFYGKHQELIFWDSQPSRTGVRDNQNDFFGAY